MSDNEKMIKTINRFLNKMDVKQLRTVLLVLYQFDKVPRG